MCSCRSTSCQHPSEVSGGLVPKQGGARPAIGTVDFARPCYTACACTSSIMPSSTGGRMDDGAGACIDRLPFLGSSIRRSTAQAGLVRWRFTPFSAQGSELTQPERHGSAAGSPACRRGAAHFRTEDCARASRAVLRPQLLAWGDSERLAASR
mmetsp:Transcript_80123/g.208217  ORF Transcript_80123/g.208217 Transcript_80123/m.208217 type:complete len:153 (+) Transcript_80123:377-835(+)